MFLLGIVGGGDYAVRIGHFQFSGGDLLAQLGQLFFGQLLAANSFVADGPLVEVGKRGDFVGGVVLEVCGVE